MDSRRRTLPRSKLILKLSEFVEAHPEIEELDLNLRLRFRRWVYRRRRAHRDRVMRDLQSGSTAR